METILRGYIGLGFRVLGLWGVPTTQSHWFRFGVLGLGLSPWSGCTTTF